MFKFAKARPQVLNDLDEYLQLIGDEPVLWLEREIRSWNEFSYEELANLIASGNIELINWQQRYARVVNDKFNPLWLAAIQAGSFASTRGRITIDDSDVRVKEFLRTHGAEFVTQLSEESKRAVANVILFGQSENLKPVDIAKLIRPLIGLNAPQAQANLNYRARVLNKLIESGLSPAQAAIRADKSAATYAVKQHKYRAETIIHTELARAYNQGAFDGVRAAVDAKLMPHCEMIWSTAGTNRVCSRCLELKDVVVGRTDEVGVQIPPLHPRCRCVIVYRESSRSTRGRGLAAGNSINLEVGGKSPYLIGTINPKDCMGKLNTLDPIVELGDKLRGATVTHNHPVGSVNEDWHLFTEFKLARLRGIDERFVYELNRDPNFLDNAEVVVDENNYTHWDNLRIAKNSGVGYRRWARE